MEVSNDGQVVRVIGLFLRAVVFAYYKGNSIDGDFAVHEPSKFTSMAKAPVSGKQCDEKQRCCEPSQLTSGGAACVKWSVYGSGAVVERDMFGGGDFPSEGSCCWE